jgi:SAM-dependent methyltransferase
MNATRIKNQILRALYPKTIRNKFLHFALRGNNVECPCCGSTYITFLPAGVLKRANAKCLKCGSLERHRTLWLYLREETNVFSAKNKILHIAPENQLYKRFTRLSNIEYYPIDINPEQYGPKTKNMDITALDYPDNFFDVVICNHVLEHVPDDKKAMSEMFRVLKKGGWALLNVPLNNKMDKTFEDDSITDRKKREEIFGQVDHVRVYGNDYKDRLKNAGFHVEVIDYVSKFDHNQQFRFGLKEIEIMWYCKK